MGNKVTFTKRAKASRCSLTLASLKLNTGMIVKDIKIDTSVLFSLVFLTPTNESKYGVKFKNMKGLNRSTTDKFIRSILERIGIFDENIFVFEAFKGKNKEVINIEKINKSCNEALILLKVEHGISYSLYEAIRNCLAHGNIIKNDGWYYLFAFSTKRRTSDENKKLKFLLKIKELNCLSTFCEVLQEYK